MTIAVICTLGWTIISCRDVRSIFLITLFNYQCGIKFTIGTYVGIFTPVNVPRYSGCKTSLNMVHIMFFVKSSYLMRSKLKVKVKYKSSITFIKYGTT